MITAEPAAAPAAVEAPAAGSEPVAAPEPPKVMTRTRGQRATRPAGPPAASGSTEPGTGSDEPGVLEGMDDQHHVEHVPVKKKGSRKR